MQAKRVFGKARATTFTSVEKMKPTPITRSKPRAAKRRSAASRSSAPLGSSSSVSTPSSRAAREMPSYAASLKLLSPRPPTSNTRPTRTSVCDPRRGGSVPRAGKNALSATQAARPAAQRWSLRSPAMSRRARGRGLGSTRHAAQIAVRVRFHEDLLHVGDLPADALLDLVGHLLDLFERRPRLEGDLQREHDEVGAEVHREDLCHAADTRGRLGRVLRQVLHLGGGTFAEQEAVRVDGDDDGHAHEQDAD